MSVQECANIQLSVLTDGRRPRPHSFQPDPGVVLVNADRELVIEMMPKSVRMDLRQGRIHCAHPGEDLAIQRRDRPRLAPGKTRSEEHTPELPSLMCTSYAVSCLRTKNLHRTHFKCQYPLS